MGNIVTDMLRGTFGMNSQQPQQNQNGTNPIGGILKMFGLVKNAQNPDQAFKAIAQENEQVQGIMKMINEQYGGDGKAAFYAKAKEMGIDPNDVLNMLK